MDIVAIKGRYLTIVAFIQCKSGKKADPQHHAQEVAVLIDYAYNCGAMPIWAWTAGRKLYFVNLSDNDTWTNWTP